MKSIKLTLATLFLCLYYTITYGQIRGTVYNEVGERLAYATVHLESTSNGVTTNSEGDYELIPKSAGTYTIVCQYLGYKTSIEQVTYENKPVSVNFTLTEESITAPTIEISADGEDPAYAIIREAIKKRKYHSDKIQSLSCASYIKGRFDMEKVPEMFVEVFVNDMNIFDVDSNGQGIVYLSESESTFYKDRPDKVKEVMHSSVVSGFDNQFSFNNAFSMDFSIYDNQLEMIRNIVSPIASGAMLYYKYELMGTTFDEKGRLLNKIKVIPKSKTSPTFSGIVYVIEDQWSVPQADLVLTSDHAQEALIDTVRYTYTSIEVEDDTWVDIKKNLWMRIKVFGFAASGGFHGVFNDFEINPAYDDKFFGREIFKVEEGANKKAEAYWDSIRPLPLTQMEQLNYVAMDSLEVIRKNRLDSMVNNPPKFGFENVIGGYSRYFDNGRLQMSYEPLNESGFNVVQGFYFGIGADIHTNRDSLHEKGWATGGSFNYSVSEEQFRGGAYFTKITNNDSQLEWTIEAGRFIQNYREIAPIHAFGNSIYSLLYEENYARFYDKTVLALEIKNEWLNGLDLRVFSEFGIRHALVNTSDYSWAKAEDKYWSNNPQAPNDYTKAFDDNEHFVIGFDASYTIGQKYISYPNRVFKMGSKYPTLHMKAAYDYNFDQESQFLHLEFGLSDTYDWSVAGDGGWNARIGDFVIDEPIYFTDYKHFDGNEIIFGVPGDYLRSFHLLPYYTYSTNGTYIEAHFQHHFRGFILDKVPLVRLLKWNLATGANYLHTNELGHYTEIYAGVENIGISFVRFLRFDVVANFDESGYIRTDYMIGLSLGDFIRSRSPSRKVLTTF